MRQAGTLSNRDQATNLADYLLTKGITAKVEADGEAWAIWVRDEDQLPEATRALQEFLADPTAERFHSAGQTAEALRKQQAREDQQRRKNLIQMRDRWEVPLGGSRPLTFLLIAASIIATLAVDFGQNDNQYLQALLFQPLPKTDIERTTWSPTQYIEQGQVWRLVTPIFIHFSPLHLIFNMYVLYLFGSLIETRRGTWRFAVLVLALAITSNFGQYFLSSEFKSPAQPALGLVLFGGMSGVGYGLFGYLWMKTQFDPFSQMFLPPSTVLWMMGWFLLCWIGLLGSIANWAHTTGLIVGAAIGYAPVAWRRMGRL